MIKNLGIKVNNKTIESDKITVLLSEFNNSVLKLSQGKRRYINKTYSPSFFKFSNVLVINLGVKVFIGNSSF